MISMFLFFFFLLFSLKDFYFLTFLSGFPSPSIFLISIFFPIFFLIKKSLFNFFSLSNALTYHFIFFLTFFLLFFCFSCPIPFYFLITVELSMILMIIFIMNFSKDLDKISSSLFMFFLNVVGSIPFMYFSSLSHSSWLISSFFLTSNYSFMMFFCFLLLLCSKLPIFLLHFWLTKAHVSASGSGSVILASLMLKIGSVGLLNWSFIFKKLCSSIMNFSLSFSIFSMVIFSVIMNRFFDIKYLVACSSIVHMSLTLPLFLSYSYLGVFSSCLMMVGHGFVSSYVFFLVSFLYESSFSRSTTSNKSMESVSTSLIFFLFFFFLVNMGFPPFIGFLSEVMFLGFLIFSSNLLTFLLSIVLLLSGVYFISLCMNFIFSKKNMGCNTPNSTLVLMACVVGFYIYLLLFLF